MKTSIKLAILLAASLVTTLTGCKKADEAVPVNTPTEIANATLGQATIKGQVFIDRDLANDQNSDGEQLPENINTDPAAGLQILVSANYGINGTNETINKFVTVDANGAFSFTMPAEEVGTNVRLEFLKLEGKQNRDGLDSDLDGEFDDEEEEDGFFEFRATSVSVKPGQTEIVPNQFFTGFVSTANPSFF